MTFLQAIDLIDEAMPGRLPKEDDPKGGKRIDLLYCLFSDIPDHKFERAIVTFLTSHKKLYPGDVWTAIIRGYALDGDKKTGLEAWGEVQEAIKKKRHDSPLLITDNIAERVAKAIGIRNLQWSENDEINRAHFIKAYEQIRDAEAQKRVAGFTQIEEGEEL